MIKPCPDIVVFYIDPRGLMWDVKNNEYSDNNISEPAIDISSEYKISASTFVSPITSIDESVNGVIIGKGSLHPISLEKQVSQNTVIFAYNNIPFLYSNLDMVNIETFTRKIVKQHQDYQPKLIYDKIFNPDGEIVGTLSQSYINKEPYAHFLSKSFIPATTKWIDSKKNPMIYYDPIRVYAITQYLSDYLLTCSHKNITFEIKDQCSIEFKETVKI